MQEQVTLVPPASRPTEGRGISSSLPPDLLEQVRGRVRLLAMLLTIAFTIDPLLFFTGYAAGTLLRKDLPADFLSMLPIRLLDVCAAAACAALWLASRNRKLPAARLHTIGLVYEVVICYIIGIGASWNYYNEFQRLPNLTWAPAIIIFFPLVLPGPPRRMLAAAIMAAAMSPLSILTLELLRVIDIEPGLYGNAIFSGILAVVFAYTGARVVYRLGREVAAARELGSYHLEERLGQGGMGEVWRARHRMLARPAAIKLIRPTSGDDGGGQVSDEAVRRFEQEAQAIARLRSPHTVNLFDFGVANTGAFYYAMELLEGLDADKLVRRFGPIPPERAIFILRQICHSLSEADACGLVHRDIKPANVFLCRYGEDFDFVKVLDFGLVKAFGEIEEARPALTRENVVHGTPAFIAPEQALGASTVDGRVDIYATGCVAFWLLTGQLVFSADTPMALVVHHAQTPPDAPSSRAAQPIPAALDRLVLSCLAKNPADRPQSARELSLQLAEIDCAEGWTEERARTWWSNYMPAASNGASESVTA